MQDEAKEQATIPVARFNEVYGRLQAAEARVKELETAAAGATSHANKATAALEARIKELSTELATTRTTHEIEKSIMAVGITDDEAIGFLRYRYSQAEADEAGNVPAFDQWFEGYREANPNLIDTWAKRATAQEPAAAPPTSSATPPAPTPKAPAVVPAEAPTVRPVAKPTEAPPDTTGNGRANGAPPILGSLTPAQIANMTPENVEAMGGWANILRSHVGDPSNSGGA